MCENKNKSKLVNKLDNKNIDIQEFFNHFHGSIILSKCLKETYNIKTSHQTLLNNFKTKRVFDKKYIIKSQTHNEHIKLKDISYFCDGFRMNHKSITKGHHDKMKFKNSPLLLQICDRKQVLHFKVFNVDKENELKYFELIEECFNQGKLKPNSFILMDRKYNDLIEMLKPLKLYVVIYSKDKLKDILKRLKEHKKLRLFNTWAERQFCNIAKVIHEDSKYLDTLNQKELKLYLFSLCQMYFCYNMKDMLEFYKLKRVIVQEVTKEIKIKQKIKR